MMTLTTGVFLKSLVCARARYEDVSASAHNHKAGHTSYKAVLSLK